MIDIYFSDYYLLLENEWKQYMIERRRRCHNVIYNVYIITLRQPEISTVRPIMKKIYATQIKQKANFPHSRCVTDNCFITCTGTRVWYAPSKKKRSKKKKILHARCGQAILIIYFTRPSRKSAIVPLYIRIYARTRCRKLIFTRRNLSHPSRAKKSEETTQRKRITKHVRVVVCVWWEDVCAVRPSPRIYCTNKQTLARTEKRKQP